MEFSVVAHFSGIPGEYSPCDTSYDDALRASQASGLSVDETEPGDSEYAYLATECGEPDPDSWWGKWKERVQDCTVSGIIGRDAFTRWLDDLGAFAEDCGTMGTLGGPLAPWGGVVADISFRIESQVLIESIRATPIPGTVDEPLGKVRGATDDERGADADRIWQRIRKATLAVYGS